MKMEIPDKWRMEVLALLKRLEEKQKMQEGYLVPIIPVGIQESRCAICGGKIKKTHMCKGPIARDS